MDSSSKKHALARDMFAKRPKTIAGKSHQHHLRAGTESSASSIGSSLVSVMSVARLLAILAIPRIGHRIAAARALIRPILRVGVLRGRTLRILAKSGTELAHPGTG